jgi:3-hydroxyisobutyrate dehydrogenase-like beta-hydroxyacid dehydrogenase
VSAVSGTDNARPANRVGIVGVGAMGGAIAANLLAKGFDVVVRDIVPERVDALVELGAHRADSAAEVAQGAAIVLTVVIDSDETDAVVFGEGADGGLVAGAMADSIVVMCSTVAPAYVVALSERLVARGVALIDAPISGGPQRARDGTLSMMAAGPEPVVERARPVLAATAARLFGVGARAGDGSAMKIVNNMLAGINLAAAAQALALAAKLGMDLALVRAVGEASSGGSWMFGDRVPRALAGDYAPRAATKFLTKDVALARAVAEETGVAASLAAAAHALFTEAVAAGCGELDDAALIEYCRTRARPERI